MSEEKEPKGSRRGAGGREAAKAQPGAEAPDPAQWDGSGDRRRR